MDQFVQPSSPPRNLKPPKDRMRWSRCIVELEGRLRPQYRHQASHLLLNSLSQTGAFAHNPGDGIGNPHDDNFDLFNGYNGCPTINPCERRKGVSAVEFDSKGIYVASVTKSGCLSVHDFETLYCSIYGTSSSTTRCTGQPVVHIPVPMHLDAIKWNPSNQDEVACASRQVDKIFVYDISCVSNEPVLQLRKGTSRLSVLTNSYGGGFSDIAFLSEDKSRLLASSLNGGIYMWDRRASTAHCLELFVKSSQNKFNSLELDGDYRVVFGATGNGVIHAWDLRGGHSSFAFQNPNEVPVLKSMKVSSLLEKIEVLKEQSNIPSRGIHSIKFDPSCSYQLAFHLDDGWSGVINVNDVSVTHVHCPPPDWLSGDMLPWSVLRRPAWLPTISVYAVGSLSRNGLYLLDFYPDKTSPSHVYFNDEIESISTEKKTLMKNKLIDTSEDVLSCAIHPSNGTIIAGTKESSLLVVSQKPSDSTEDSK